MAEVTVQVGGRSFQVVCQEGQETYLHSAAAMLDGEAQKLEQDGVRITENDMLLMSGLLLADRTAALEDSANKNESQALKNALGAEAAKTASAEAKLVAANDQIMRLKSELSSLHKNVDEQHVNSGPDLQAELEAAGVQIDALTFKLEKAEENAATGAQDAVEKTALAAALERSQADVAELNGRVEEAESAIVMAQEKFDDMLNDKAKQGDISGELISVKEDRDSAIEALSRVVKAIEAKAVEV